MGKSRGDVRVEMSGGKRSTIGDVVCRGDRGSSIGRYRDAISETLIGNRGISFGPCDGVSILRRKRKCEQIKTETEENQPSGYIYCVRLQHWFPC